MVANMKEVGKMISDMEKPLKGIPMVIAIMVILLKESLKVRVFILGQMEKSMMEPGLEDLNKVMVFGEGCLMTHILENGLNLKLMVMVFIHGKMVIVMRENGILV